MNIRSANKTMPMAKPEQNSDKTKSSENISEYLYSRREMPGLFNRKARFAKIFYRKTFRFLPKKRSSNTTQSLSSDSFSEPEVKPVYSSVLKFYSVLKLSKFLVL